MTLLLVVTASPYLATTLLFAHGHHRVTTNVENGSVALVFHHDGEDSDHHHENQPHDKDDHSTNGDDHHLATLSADVAIFPSLSTQVVAKIIPIVSFSDILTAFSQVLTLDAWRNLMRNEAERIPISIFSVRTIVLLM